MSIVCVPRGKEVIIYVFTTLEIMCL